MKVETWNWQFMGSSRDNKIWVSFNDGGNWNRVENLGISDQIYLLDVAGSVDGQPDWDNPIEVTAPEGQEFLDNINKVFLTDFKLSQFAGR